MKIASGFPTKIRVFLSEHDSRGPLAIGASASTWTPSCNRSIRVELDGQCTTSNSRALLLGEALDSSGVMSRLRTIWSTCAIPPRCIAARSGNWPAAKRVVTTPLAQERPSQATLSRFLGCLGSDENIDVVHEGLLKLAIWRLTSLNGGERPTCLTLDIDGLPIEVFGHQGGSAFHGHVDAWIYSPLITPLTETGDMLRGLLREGNAGPAENADTWIPHLVRRLNEGLEAEVRVRIDAGFTDNDTLEALEEATSSTWDACAATLGCRCGWCRNGLMICSCIASSWSPASANSTRRQRKSWPCTAIGAALKLTWAR